MHFSLNAEPVDETAVGWNSWFLWLQVVICAAVIASTFCLGLPELTVAGPALCLLFSLVVLWQKHLYDGDEQDSLED